MYIQRHTFLNAQPQLDGSFCWPVAESNWQGDALPAGQRRAEGEAPVGRPLLASQFFCYLREKEKQKQQQQQCIRGAAGGRRLAPRLCGALAPALRTAAGFTLVEPFAN
ncbi:unnamed protein product [Prorocentrum cordatum]|uniref:Uncharacterized protein n=1 Tax=Prorocentrum cordatum TaxID=2364126 RepID=A0ABN9X836_9DINO|nr:unnamed protein product [Polarella glacialis]